MGVVTAAVSLIDALSKKAPDEYKGCVPLAVSRLSRIVTSSYTGNGCHEEVYDLAILASNA